MNTVAKKRPPQQSPPSKSRLTVMQTQIASHGRHETPLHHCRRGMKHKRLASDNSQCLKWYILPVLVALVVGLAVVFYAYPEIFATPKGAVHRPRHIVTLFPEPVQRRLPYFTGKYAIATDENNNARRLLRRLTSNRRTLGAESFQLFAWEKDQFELQLQSDERIDAACGVKGVGMTYHVHNWLKNYIILWCLLQGRPDGYIDWNITPEPGWQRNPRGVIAKHFVNEESGSRPSARYDPSILLLPINDSNTTSYRISQTNSNLPAKVLEWIVQTGATLSQDTFHGELGNFLHEHVKQDSYQWSEWLVACSESQKRQLEETAVLMASTCSQTTQHESCCSYYSWST